MNRPLRARAPAPPKRVSCTAVAACIDAVLARLDDDAPTAVYQYLGHRLGIHPTTVLRYHRGNLHTAPAAVLDEARRLESRVAELGALPPLDSADEQPPPRPHQVPRVPSWRLAHLLDRLIEALELTEPSALHRLLARDTGIHPTTVLRIHRGILRSAPATLLTAATELEERVRAGEAIRFPHGNKDTTMVTRTAFVQAVDGLLATGLFRDRNKLLHYVEDELGLPRGRLTRLYRCRTFRWVPNQVQVLLEQLHRRCQYDPSLLYRVGDRFYHHVFGAGTVTGKEPVDKIRVQFDDGTVRILRERLRENGYWLQPSNSPAPGEAYAVGLFGR